MMDQNDPTCKSFHDASPRFEPGVLPPWFARLIEGTQIFDRFDATDLRETSKFGELPNIEGLAAHPLRNPAPAGPDPLTASPEPYLPGGAQKSLRRRLTANPLIVTRGALAGPSGLPVSVQTLVPQSHAHLAQALRRMLWPAAPAQSIDYTLFIWPEPLTKPDGASVLEAFIGHWPDERFGLIVGFDDPRLIARLMLDAAHRRWASRPGELWFVPAGEAVATQAEGAALAVYTPVLDSAALSPAERVASQEPLLLEKDHTLTPVWAWPLLPADLLAADPVWRTAALTPGALPLGVEVDVEGRFPLFHERATPPTSPDPGAIVVPRPAIPVPYLRETRRYRMAHGEVERM